MSFTLIPEDGSGLANANAFASNQEVTDLLAGHPFADAWTACTVQDQCIAEATAWLSRLRWQGLPTYTQRQALAWPRLWVPMPDRAAQVTGQPNLYDYLSYPGNVVPAFIKRATARLSLYLAQQVAAGSSPLALTGLVAGSEMKVGPLTFTPIAPATLPPDVLQEIKPALRAIGVTVIRA